MKTKQKNTKIIMEQKTIQSKFKKLFKLKITPKLKKKDKLDSERDKLDSERDKLDSERDKIYSEINKLNSEKDKIYSERDKLNSEINKLDSERNKIYSEINKIYSEINKLDSEILLIFYEFGKENNCQVMWKDYCFNLEDTELKFYNKDKTGFNFIDMEGNVREELFKPKEKTLEELSKEQLIEKIKELQDN